MFYHKIQLDNHSESYINSFGDNIKRAYGCKPHVELAETSQADVKLPNKLLKNGWKSFFFINKRISK